MSPGEHRLVKGTTGSVLGARGEGLAVRDSVLVILPGPRLDVRVLVREPLDGALCDNALRHGAGGLDIDSCRIVVPGGSPSIKHRQTATRTGNAPIPGSTAAEATARGRIERRGSAEAYTAAKPGELIGRWPPNLLFVHDRACRPLGKVPVRATSIHGEDVAVRRSGVHSRAGGHQSIGRVQPVRGYASSDGTETVQTWSCTLGCPVPHLDMQSGDRPSTLTGRADGPAPNPATARPDAFLGSGLKGGIGPVYADGGGASRFYPQLVDEEEVDDWLGTLIGDPCRHVPGD